MRQPDDEELAGFPDGEYTLVYGDEAWLLFLGDVKSAAYGQWLEKVRGTGRIQ